MVTHREGEGWWGCPSGGQGWSTRSGTGRLELRLHPVLLHPPSAPALRKREGQGKPWGDWAPFSFYPSPILVPLFLLFLGNQAWVRVHTQARIWPCCCFSPAATKTLWAELLGMEIPCVPGFQPHSTLAQVSPSHLPGTPEAIFPTLPPILKTPEN